jgi:septal ring factor EnvC (AmiA/AmiB activator)
MTNLPRRHPLPLVAALAGLALLPGTPGAQLPTIEQMRAMPLPGPSPADVVRTPPPLPAAGAAAVVTPVPSPWDALHETEEELRRRETDLDRVRLRIARATEDLRVTREHLRDLEAGVESLRREVMHRTILLDRVARGGVARIVLTAGDPGEARFRARLVRRLIAADGRLARRYAEVRTEAETVRAGIESRLDAQRRLEAQLDERRRQLEDELRRHRSLVGRLSRPDALPGLRAEALGELNGIARATEIRPTAATDLRPLAERLVAFPASFPVETDDLRGGLALHAPPGLPVASPVAGTVAFAGRLAGFGPAVLIRTADGDGILVGRLGTLAVGTGDVVTEGSALGTTAASYSPLLPPLLLNAVSDEPILS